MSLKNQNGFSLIGVMVMAAILSITFLILQSVKKSQIRAERTNKMNLEIARFQRNIKTFLKNKKNCEINFVGKTNSSLPSLKNSKGREIFKVSQELGQRLIKLGSFKLEGIPIKPVLTISFEKLRGFMGAKITSKQIPLSLVIKEDVVESCL